MSLVTYKGIKFDYLNPTPEMIDIDDIVQSLTRINRFVGHSKRAYSVAEHSIYCYEMAKKIGYSNRECLLTLIHDFTEAYVGDCPAPLKELLPKFSSIESKVEEAICKHIGIEPPTSEEHEKIKRIDLTMLLIEMRDLTKHSEEFFLKDTIYSEFLSDEDFFLSFKDISVCFHLDKVLKKYYMETLEKVKKEG
ncbi:hypothetical protein MOD25_05075 [Bacillus haynesii]|uniref:hypothetical protein n=1 Tax=Bacillus haynesii TaxID=1925021 RepID=UPI00228255BD|nr:hypothetical protein [Bacillus haynesii]MCY8549278.1 hypothetical protein [Bacillus haynesii]